MLYCQKGFICGCSACCLATDPYRCGPAESAVSSGSVAGWTVHTDLDAERRLAGGAARLSHQLERGGPPTKCTADRSIELATFTAESEHVLGDGHFATQAFRRMGLAQAMATGEWLAAGGIGEVAGQRQVASCNNYLLHCAHVLSASDPDTNH